MAPDRFVSGSQASGIRDNAADFLPSQDSGPLKEVGRLEADCQVQLFQCSSLLIGAHQQESEVEI